MPLLVRADPLDKMKFRAQTVDVCSYGITVFVDRNRQLVIGYLGITADLLHDKTKIGSQIRIIYRRIFMKL